MIIPIPEAGKFGIVVDRPFTEIPLNAWTDAKNFRFRAGVAEKFTGEVKIFNTPQWAPHWLLHSAQTGIPFWLYASTAKVGATDGINHADITRAAGGDYTPNLAVGWTGAVIEGVPVINNGADIPQMWNKPSLAQRLQNLTGWNTAWRANTLTGLKRYLIALDISKSGVRFPTMVKWSHQAPTGDVPQTWNEEDDQLDAAEYSLPGEAGFLVDGVRLRDALILYQEFQTWQMTYVAGIDIFRFTQLFENIGALNRRCALEFFSGKHLVFTGDDVVLHDGHQAKSLLSERARKALVGKVDSTNYSRSFVVADYLNSEVFICHPEVGQSVCTRALVWNWLNDTWGVRELPGVSHIANGLVAEGVAGETWASAAGTWEDDDTPWGDRASDPTKRALLMAVPGSEDSSTWKLLHPDTTQTFEGRSFTAYLERLSLGLPTKVDGPPNYTRMKQVLSVWPRIEGTPGGVINVSLGTQERIGSSVNWAAARSFIIGETEFCDFSDVGASKLHAIRFESNSDLEWKLSGWDADVIDRGSH